MQGHPLRGFAFPIKHGLACETELTAMMFAKSKNSPHWRNTAYV